MKSNLSFYIGMRYALSKRKEGFLSFISGFSFFAMAIGVMTLIVVLSVMNGFDREIKHRLLNVIPHITLTDRNGLSAQQINQLSSQLAQASPKISSITPHLENHAMLAAENRQQAVVVRGISDSWPSAELLGDNMLIGSVDDLQPRQFGILLGSQLIRQLGLSIGDQVELILPTLSVTPLGVFPRLKRMTVLGVFEVGAQVDATTAYIHEMDARLLMRYQDTYPGIQIQLYDPFAVDKILEELAEILPSTLEKQSWTAQMSTLFQAMRMEKTVVGLLLSVVIAVAAFNIIACLVLMVANKRKDIAVLRTLGARSDQIVKLFIIQGSAIGILGALSGLIAGCIVALSIGDIISFVESITGQSLFDPSIYMISALPSKLLLNDVLMVVIGATLTSLLATIYPAWRAGQILPAEALRYDQ
ncbi:lipoprotein-releasing ABC transporter permease subunit [Porticoccaceae bacterium]|nr:lipoprotein-releasing ABC transporter permease subunit [Porticoccaceae bacterium]